MRAEANVPLERLYYHLSSLQCFIRVETKPYYSTMLIVEIPEQGGRKYRMK